jgi:cysteine synthase
MTIQQKMPPIDFEDLKIAGFFGPKASILDTIGRTPVVQLNRMAPKNVSLFVKLESFNPLGSVKDRLALGVIEAAEKSGALKPGQTVIEATSGNTGIGLAMVCAQKGYPLVIVMAESFSVERRKLMRFLGAKVVLTPAAEKGTGMLAKARELAETRGWFLTNQFENPANADIHSKTTAVEILADFADIGLDYWVSGFGTGGTLQGVSRVLKTHSPQTRVVVVEPDNVPMLSSGLDNVPGQSHPRFRPHPMQGWSPDFLSELTLGARDANHIDLNVGVSGAAAMETARKLATQEGILAGISGGATVAAALEVAKSAPDGSRILAMVPDTGERYLSTVLFDGIEADMNGEETEISRSTPGCRFDAPKAAAPSAPVPIPEPTSEASDFVDAAINDPDMPVVIFALEWCEFCWAVRKLFRAIGLSYRSVDLDSAAFQGGQAFSTEVRKALHKVTGTPTIPQIFVGGHLIGGATDVLAAFNSGALGEALTGTGVSFDPASVTDATSFLPQWVQKR